MSQQLVVFKGEELTAVQDDAGQWCVPLNVLSRTVEVDGNGQRQRLARLAENGLKWAAPCMVHVVAPDGSSRPTVCLLVDSIPMWAATIDLSRVASDRAREMLRAYQDEVAELLAALAKGEAKVVRAGEALPMDEARLRFIIREEMQRQDEPPTPLPTLTHVQHTHGSFVLYEALHIKKSFTSEELARRLPCREQTVHDISLTHCNPTRLLRGRFQDVLGIATEAWDKPVGAKMERVDRPAQALPEGATPKLPDEKKRPNKDDLHRVAEALKKYPDAPPRVIIAAARIKRSIGYAALRMLANAAAATEGLH